MPPVEEDTLLSDGLRFKNDMNDSNSGLSCLRTALYLMREQYIDKAKKAAAKKNEEKVTYYMGIVEGIDLSIKHPESMIAKWDAMIQEKFNARQDKGEPVYAGQD